MTPNNSLSIPNALKRERPEDYYENTATIEWPLGPDGERFSDQRRFSSAPRSSRTVATSGAAKEFIRFLVAEGWLAHYLDFAGDRMLPPMPKLLEAPFWLDPSDPHRMAAVMQVASRPVQHDYTTVSGDCGTTWSGRRESGRRRPPRRRRGDQPRAGGRRGDRPDQADPERVAGHSTSCEYASSRHPRPLVAKPCPSKAVPSTTGIRLRPDVRPRFRPL